MEFSTAHLAGAFTRLGGWRRARFSTTVNTTGTSIATPEIDGLATIRHLRGTVSSGDKVCEVHTASEGSALVRLMTVVDFTEEVVCTEAEAKAAEDTARAVYQSAYIFVRSGLSSEEMCD